MPDSFSDTAEKIMSVVPSFRPASPQAAMMDVIASSGVTSSRLAVTRSFTWEERITFSPVISASPFSTSAAGASFT